MMALEFCKRCKGTGHDGNCDVCGGSGFIDPDESSKPLPTQRTVGRLGKSSINDPVAPPQVAHPENFIAGMPRARMRFEFPNVELSLRVIEPRILTLRQKYPYDIDFLAWISPSHVIVTRSNGDKIEERFTGRKIKRRSVVRDTTPSRLVTVPTRVKGKQHARTIPNPVQKEKQAKNAITERQPPIGTGVLVRVPKAPDTKKPETTGNVPKHKSSKPSKQSKSIERRADKMLGKNNFLQDEKTAFEVAFERAQNQKDLDGSKDWHSIRESGTGQFGSFPAFDPADSYDE